LQRMKCICASSVTLGREAFSSFSEVELVPETEITPDRLKGMDALITRSKTRLDAELLAGTGVRFAGTCTAGTDHVREEELRELGIVAASAPGCNANAVSEYVLAALLEASRKTGFQFSGKTMGVVGVGQVGSRVAAKAEALGFRVLLNDPPREHAGESGPFVSLSRLLSESDVVTLHVPLVEQDPFPTRRLITEAELAQMKAGALLLNACRGEVLNAEAAVAARRAGRLSWLVLDVWEPEPDFPEPLLSGVDLATPHIAGHSVEGKVNGTRQIRDQLVASAGLNVEPWDAEALLPPPVHPEIKLPATGCLESRLGEVVRACYDITLDDWALRVADVEPGKRFTTLRRNYRDRREFSATRVTDVPESMTGMLSALGFTI